MTSIVMVLLCLSLNYVSERTGPLQLMLRAGIVDLFILFFPSALGNSYNLFILLSKLGLG